MDGKKIVDAAGVEVTNNPLGGQRRWIKLWVDPWLTGTTRYVCTDAESAFWIDLLAEAGRSRFSGRICPGLENGQLIGYPLAYYQRLRPSLDVMATLEKFAVQGKILFTITCKNPVSLVVQIINWDKYQAPLDGATRNREYRKRKKTVVVSDRDGHRDGKSRRLDTDSETKNRDATLEEGEKRKRERRGREEAEEDALRAKVAAAAAGIAEAFQLFNQAGAFGSLAFQLEWYEAVQTSQKYEGDLNDREHFAFYFPGTIERCIQNCLRKGIPVPKPVYVEARIAENNATSQRQWRTDHPGQKFFDAEKGS